MAKQKRGHSEPVTALNQPSPCSYKSQTRLVIPVLADPQRSQDALRHVVEDWLLPSLLKEFLSEKEITPKSRFLPKVPY